MDLAEGSEMGQSLFSSSPARSNVPSRGSKARSAVSSLLGEGSTRHLSSSEEVDVEDVEEGKTVDSIQYEELLEVVTCVVAKLNLDWPTELTS